MKNSTIRFIPIMVIFALVFTLFIPGCSKAPADNSEQQASLSSEAPVITPEPTAEPVPTPAEPTLTPEPTPEPTHEPTPEPTEPIVYDELSGPVYIVGVDNTYSGGSNHSFVVNDASKRFIDDSKVGEEISFEYAGRHFEAVYDHSVNRFLGNYIFDEYFLLNYEPPRYSQNQCIVRLLPDGTILGFYNTSFYDVTLPEYCDSEILRSFIEESYKDLIDFGRFEYCFVEAPPENEVGENGEGCYYLTWYNNKGDVMEANYLFFVVTKFGNRDCISGPKMYFNAAIDVSGAHYISSESVEERLKGALSELYGQDDISFDLVTSMVTNYKGECCVYCEVCAHFDPSDCYNYDVLELVLLLDAEPAE